MLKEKPVPNDYFIKFFRMKAYNDRHLKFRINTATFDRF